MPWVMTNAAKESLLDLDRDLGRDLSDDAEDRAQSDLRVDVVRVRAGRWDPEQIAVNGGRGGFGLFVADGFLVRAVTLAHRTAAELAGPGDVIRPWRRDEFSTSYPLSLHWRLLSPVTVAVLGHDATSKLCGYPEVISQLAERMVARSRRQACLAVIGQLAAVEHRILLVLWQLADEFGRVRPDGVLVPVPMTHEVLGMLVGARRPTVTGALGVLSERDLVHPVRGEGWLLKGDPPTDLDVVRGNRL
jgi:CRP-like cAMP-binding protein